jgi:hypothetical protein
MLRRHHQNRKTVVADKPSFATAQTTFPEGLPIFIGQKTQQDIGQITRAAGCVQVFDRLQKHGVDGQHKVGHFGNARLPAGDPRNEAATAKRAQRIDRTGILFQERAIFCRIAEGFLRNLPSLPAEFRHPVGGQ